MRAIWQPTRQSIRRVLPAVVIAATVAAVTGCVATSALKNPEVRPPGGTAAVLVMRPDVELSEVTAAGLEEPNAQWTARGLAHVKTALAETLAARNAKLIEYREPSGDAAREHAHAQLLKLHAVVGSAIIQHKYNPAAALPTKTDRFDWSLGADARRLHEEFGADYALFVFLHDSYASGGRVAMIVAMAAFGVGVPGGIQRGFASLVDLRSGDIAWFNMLVRGSGDLRELEPAREAVTTLLAELPL